MDYPSIQSRDKILRSLIASECLFDAADFSEDSQEADAVSTQRLLEPLLQTTGTLWKLVTGLPIFFIPTIHLDFDTKKFQSVTAAAREHADLVCFRFVYSQPVIVAVIFSDHLDARHRHNLFEKLDRAVLAFSEHTSSMTGPLSSVKLGTFGILLWCFEDAASSAQFIQGEQPRLKSSHFWRKTYTVSWCVDLQNSQVTKHKGFPIISNSTFNYDKFVGRLHDTPDRRGFSETDNAGLA